MTFVLDNICMTDVIVLASPVYYYTWTAQLKTVIDRTYAMTILLCSLRIMESLLS